MIVAFLLFLVLTLAFVGNWAFAKTAVLFPWKQVVVFGVATVFTLHMVVQEALLERKLMKVARDLYSVRHPIECASFFRAMSGEFAPAGGGVAWVRTKKQDAVLAMDVCDNLKSLINNPRQWSPEQAWAVHVFTHEVMHLRGELDEQRTDCQAYQRSAQVAQALGVRQEQALQMTLHMFREIYPRHPYNSTECAKGRGLDENLPTSPWNFASFK